MLSNINALLSGIAVPIMLCLSGLFFCIKLRAFHIKHPLLVIKELCRGAKAEGDVSPLSALSLALAGTLGVGNIVGVASAIALGGFGAVFWIWVSALLSMILKYAEIVLAMTHKRGGVGSAMFFIRDFFDRLGASRIGKAVAAIFAASFVLCSLTMGSMLQSGAVAEALCHVCGIPPWLVGAVLCILTLAAALGGTKRLTGLTGIFVPIMSVGYIVLSLCVIVRGRGELTNAFFLIFSNAFSAKSATAGVGGFAFMKAVRYGVMRGLVSNEAGCGTAPTAHALADNPSPARQGLWGIFEVFTDTVVLCTLTALVLILEWDSASNFIGNYMSMNIAAFSSLGAYAEYFLAIAVTAFGFATVLCWVHYGTSAAQYLFPRKQTKTVFAFIFSFTTLLGTLVSSESIWMLSDISMSIMTLINLTVITQMWREVKRETDCIFTQYDE